MLLKQIEQEKPWTRKQELTSLGEDKNVIDKDVKADLVRQKPAHRIPSYMLKASASIPDSS